MNSNMLQKLAKTDRKDALGISVKVIFGVFMLARTVKTMQEICRDYKKDQFK